jgi:hypothetical protein
VITQKSFKRNGSPELLVHHSAFLAPLALDSNPLGEQALFQLIPNAPDCGGRDAIHPRHPEVNAQSTSTFRRKIQRLITLAARRTWPAIALVVLASLAGNGLCAAIPKEAKDGLPAIGSAAMEATLANTIEPGDRVLVAVKGYFGHRLVNMAQRYGAEVVTIQKPWGEAFTLEEITAALKTHQPDLMAIVHAETSTGVRHPWRAWVPPAVPRAVCWWWIPSPVWAACRFSSTSGRWTWPIAVAKRG